MANMERILEIAEKYHLKVMEDSAEAQGTYYTEGKFKGRHAGTLGDIGIYSFNANKIITTGGGGMIVSHNPEYIEKARFYSTQAKTDSLYFVHDEIGYNYRMLNLQAALGTVQIDQLEGFIEIKKKNYERYKKGIAEIDGLSIMLFNEGIRPNYWFYSILIDKEKYGLSRDELLVKLNDAGIQLRPIWYLNHMQKPFADNIAYKMEKSVYYIERVLNVPCSTNLTEQEVDVVLGKLREFRKEHVSKAV
jgi:dTDP-4-amino-4,6-dideoxygalactose transaminase